MDPITYTIGQAAEILKCKEENILHMGVTGHWKIYVLSSIFPLYHIIKTFNQLGDDIEQCHFSKEYEVGVPRDEDDRLPFQRLMQLSPCCLERFEAGELDAKVVLKSQEVNDDSRIYFGLYTSRGEPLKLTDCKLAVEAKDISKLKEKLTAKKESETLNANQIEVDATTPDSQDPEPSENNLPAIEQKATKISSHKELKQGLKEIWEKEGKPSARFFFPTILRKYINKSGSPITDVFYAGKDAGISYRLSTGTTGSIIKKTICNYVCEFKKSP